MFSRSLKLRSVLKNTSLVVYNTGNPILISFALSKSEELDYASAVQESFIFSSPAKKSPEATKFENLFKFSCNFS